MSRASQKIILNGQEISLKHLEGILPKTQALIVNRLLYYLNFNNYIFEENKKRYIRKSLKEWAHDIEIWFGNGTKRNISKTAICNAFNKLKKSGIVILAKDFSRVSLYGIDENVLSKKLKKRFFDYQDIGTESYLKLNDKLPISYRRVNDQSIDQQSVAEDSKMLDFSQSYDSSKITSELSYCGKNMNYELPISYLKLNDKLPISYRKVNDKSIDQQGLDGNLASGTYTNTSTYTNNKSHKSERKGNDKNIIQKMFQIWQDEFPESDEVLSKQTACWLKSAFDSAFEKDLTNWRNYLKTVKTSRFIMSRPHLMQLKWLLNFDTIANIRRKAYEVGELQPDTNELDRRQEYLFVELESQIGALSEHETCKERRRKILQKIGPFAYRSWFSKISMELCDGQINCLGSKLNLDRIAVHYGDLLKLDAEIISFDEILKANCK